MPVHVHGDPSVECVQPACPFTGMRFVPAVSDACKGDMHPACLLCGCYCHHICERCINPCRTVYENDGQMVCSDCYRATLTGRPESGCMNCPNRNAYRDPRSGDSRHLCTECHKEAGHRWQDGNGWHEPGYDTANGKDG